MAGAINEAVDILNHDGIKASSLIFTELWPFPGEATTQSLKSAGRIFLVENNATGQLGELIRSQTGIPLADRILRYDGRPMLPEKIAQEVKGGL
jgi:2-oxoglutarate ferredoxin oxidoreductase subunit alpha